MAKRLISSENYTIPVILAILVHVLVLGGFFIVWTSTPEVPVAKPTMIATLYDVNSKSPATTESSENTAGEGNKLVAPPATDNKMGGNNNNKDKVDEKNIVKQPNENITKEKLEKDRIAKEKLEKDRLAKEKLEKDRIAKEKLEKDRIAKEKLEKDRLAKEKLEKDRLAKEKLEKDRIAKEKLEKDRVAKEKLEKDRLAKEKAANEAQALADLLGNKVELPPTKGDELGDKATGSYDDLIRQLVQENWTELGNAPPGTRVELTIQMIPDGTITNVTVNRSSGNAAFDASAVTAVRNVGRIPQMQNLDINTFNQNYRQKSFIFSAKGPQ